MYNIRSVLLLAVVTATAIAVVAQINGKFLLAAGALYGALVQHALINDQSFPTVRAFGLKEVVLVVVCLLYTSIARKLISSQPRYDHFDTAASVK